MNASMARATAVLLACLFSWRAWADIGVSPTFTLDTRRTEVTAGAASASFALDTRNVGLSVQDGLSLAFALDTRSLYQPVTITVTPPVAYDTYTDSTLPYFTGRGHFERWNGSGWQVGADTASYSAANLDVYIIAHGWNFPPPYSSALSEIDWLEDIAKDLSAHDPNAIVLGWNWLESASGINPKTPFGMITAESDKLAALVLSSGLMKAKYIHWIGFSFGSGVVSQAALAVTHDLGTKPEMRVTTLDPPESNIADQGSARLNLGASIKDLITANVPVDNYASEFGRPYTDAANVNLRAAADVTGTPSDWLHDHVFAPHWFEQTVARRTDVMPSGPIADYFHYFNAQDRLGTWAGHAYMVPNAVEPFWSGADRAGYTFNPSLNVGNWRPKSLRYAYFTEVGLILNHQFSLDSFAPSFLTSWPILYTTTYQPLIDLASNKTFPGVPGFYPFMLERDTQTKAGEVIDFEPTYTVLKDTLLGNPDAWSAEGTASVRENALYLTAAPESYAFRSVDIPANAVVMRFEQRFEGIESGDRIFVYIDGDLVYQSEAFPYMEGTFQDSGWMDIFQWAGQTVELTILLSRDTGSTSPNPLFGTVRNLTIAAEEPSYWLKDTDGDGLNNYEELVAGTNAGLSDTDNDGMPDPWELRQGFNPLDPADSAWDADGDTYTNLAEYQQDTNPLDPGEPSVTPVFDDVNGNGAVNATDVQLVINGALGKPIAYSADLNGDGKTNATDVQMVINAVLGITRL